MHIQTLEVSGLKSAMHAMRDPMSSWEKNDTSEMDIGPNDSDLTARLIKAGPEHSKHLRMIMVWADIDAPRFWWTQFDTYRIGVEKNSTSTMHKIMSRNLTYQDFETDECNSWLLANTIEFINSQIEEFRSLGPESHEKKAQLFRAVVLALPQSYIQKRTVMMSYAALRNMLAQRKGHKLKEWYIFRQWALSLPESWMLFDQEENNGA